VNFTIRRFRLPFYCLLLGLLSQWLFPTAVLAQDRTHITPQLRGGQPIEPEARAVLQPMLSLSQEEVKPGETVELTVLLSNEGTAVAEPQTLVFRLSDDLSLVPQLHQQDLSAQDASSADYVLTSRELAPYVSQKWTISLQVSQTARTHQGIGLYVYNQGRSHSVQAGATLRVTGAVATPENVRAIEDPSWMPRFVAPTTSLFSGAASYFHTFDVPPGRRGLQPSLGLSYNSRSSDGTTDYAHSGEVGEGWSLAGIPSITRVNVKYGEATPPTIPPIHVVNHFSLVINGESYTLEAGPDSDIAQYGIYHAEGNPALYVERRNDLNSNGSAANVTKEYWLVRTPDGTEYRFGFNEDSEQILYRTDGVSVYDPFDPPPAAYTGVVAQISTYRWWLDQVVDVDGNMMAFDYIEDTADQDGNEGCLENAPNDDICREVATYLEHIYYNNNNASPANPAEEEDWESQVTFEYIGSGHAQVEGEGPIFATMRRLSNVIMEQAGQITWQYELVITDLVPEDDEHIAILTDIKKFDFEEEPTQTEPPVEFEYEDLENAEGIWYPHLKVVHNGYGGLYEFTYAGGISLFDHQDIRSHYVTDLRYWDDEGDYAPAPDNDNATTHVHYDYSEDEACFDTWQVDEEEDPLYICDLDGQTDDSYKLAGFVSVDVTVRAGDAGTILRYETTDFYVGHPLLMGKQDWQGHYDNLEFLLDETSHFWTIDGEEEYPQCPQDGLPPEFPTNPTNLQYACLVESESVTYFYDEEEEEVTSYSTLVENDYEPADQTNEGDDLRQWGLVTERRYYYRLNDDPYMLEKSEVTRYRNNTDPDIWIIVPWLSRTNDPNGDPIARTFYLYDEETDPDDQEITEGKLTLIRATVSFEDVNSGSDVEFETVDTTFDYDTYGNQTAVSSFPGYGRIGYSDSSPNNWDLTTTPPGGGSAARTVGTEYVSTSFGLQVEWVDQWLENPGWHRVTYSDYHDRFTWIPTEVTDANDHTTTYTYDNWPRPVEIFRPGDTNPAVEYVYDLDEVPLRIDAIIQPDAGSTIRQQTTNYYNGLGQLIQSSAVRRSFDDVPTYTEGDAVTLYSYDALGRPICESVPFAVAPYGGAYQSSTACTSVAHTATTYDYRGGVRFITTPDSETTTRSFLIPGKCATLLERGLWQERFESPKGDITLNTYDAFGRLSWVGQAEGDGIPCASTETEPLNITTYDYDTAGNLTLVTRGGTIIAGEETPGAIETTMAYDSLGRKLEMVDPDMGPWFYDYDPAGSLISQTDANEKTIDFAYDNIGRLRRKLFPFNSSPLMADFVYDKGEGDNLIGRLASASTWDATWQDDFNDGASGSDWAFSGSGSSGTVNNPQFDSNGLYVTGTGTYSGQRQTATISAREGILVYFWVEDEVDTDAYMKVQLYTSSGSGLFWGVRLEDGAIKVIGAGDVTIGSYEAEKWYGAFIQIGAAGWRSVNIWPLAQPGAAISYRQEADPSYSTYNWLTQFVANEGTLWVENYSEVALETERTYSYTDRGMVDSETAYLPGGYTYQMSYNYDVLDRPLSAVYPDGETVNYGYNNAQPKTLQASSDWLVDNTIYNVRGQMDLLDLGNGVTTEYTYLGASGAFRLQNLLTTAPGPELLQDITYDYDEVGNILSIADEATGDAQVFEYDALNRLTSAFAEGVLDPFVSAYSHNYVYDKLGNIVDNGEVAYTYDGTQPHAVDSLDNGHYYYYDDNGNMIGRYEGDNQYGQVFDVQNQLVQVVATDGSITTTHDFVYDAAGGRVIASDSTGDLTLYPFPGYEVDDPNTNDQMARSLYHLGGRLVAQREVDTSWMDDFNDNNATGWTAGSGTWTVVSESSGDYAYQQSDSSQSYSNRPLTASATEPMIITWAMTLSSSDSNRQGGLHFYASANGNINHGSSYLIRQRANDLSICKTVSNGNPTCAVTESDVPAVSGTTYTYRVTYNPNTGRIDVYRNDNVHLYWTDSSPLTSGSYLGLRTRDATVRFDDIHAGTYSLTFFHDDHLGSVSLMTDAAGQLVDEARYLPFGGYRDQGEPTANLTDHGFTGHKHNDDIGLIYMQARYYVPYINRFASADTIIPDPSDPQSFNRYSYVRNNPLNRIDPTGHIDCETLGTEECDEEGNFVDAPPTPDQIQANWHGKTPLPEGSNGVDVTLWLYEQMIGNATSMDAQSLKSLWDGSWLHPVESLAWGATVLDEWRDRVGYGEIWDFKKDFNEAGISTVTLAGHEFRMDIVANIHYGYVGKEIGIWDTLLYAGAGHAQGSGPAPEQGRWWSWGDAPEDSYAIGLGISLHDSFSTDMTYEEFVYTINLYVDNGWLDGFMVPEGN
jgi:RHS repeat-associated protein